MTPALVRLHDFEPGRPSTSSLAHKAKEMRIQYSRSAAEASNGGIGENTIIFIVLGVVCFLVILLGFYFVSRHRAPPSAGPNIFNLHQHSPITHSPRSQSEPDMSERWKVWKIWRRTSPLTPNMPTSRLSPAPAPITKPSRIRIRRGPSKTYPPIVVRPSHSRRPTNLSVATSFPHSHITEEALSDFHASAYDLDGDLETEMLHSARDDVWMGHSFPLEEAMEARGDATPIMEGGVRGDVPTRPATQWGGGDYENLGACEAVASATNPVDSEGDALRVEVTVHAS